MSATKGPWQYYELKGEDGLGYIRPDPEDGDEIAHLGDMDRPPDENRANGRLIAAAPDLLAALIDITDQLERVGDNRKDAEFIDAARAAIAKTEVSQ